MYYMYHMYYVIIAVTSLLHNLELLVRLSCPENLTHLNLPINSKNNEDAQYAQSFI